MLISQQFRIDMASFFIIQSGYLSEETILYLILTPSRQPFLDGFPVFAVEVDEPNQLQIFLQNPIVSVQVSLEIVLVMILDLFGSPAFNRKEITFEMSGNVFPLLFSMFSDQDYEFLVLGLIPIDSGLIGQSTVSAVAHLSVSSLNLRRDFLKACVFIFAQSEQKSILLFRPRFFCLLVTLPHKVLASYRYFLIIMRELALVLFLDGCKALVLCCERSEVVTWIEEVKVVLWWVGAQVIEHHGSTSLFLELIIKRCNGTQIKGKKQINYHCVISSSFVSYMG